MRLAYVHPGEFLDAKAEEAIVEYAATWPGEIHVITRSAHASRDEFNVLATDDVASAIRRLRPNLIGALHKPEFEYLMELAPVVYTSEFTRRIRTEAQNVGVRSRVAALRVAAGGYRSDLVYRRMARAAAGLQCNGAAAWNDYGRLSPRALLFHDHRIREADLSTTRARPTWDGLRPLRVAFSGRHVAIKGPATVLRVAERLPAFEFVMLGDGELRNNLEHRAPANVKFLGNLQFEAWKSYMREEVDIALLPHPQGDPSCTYFEALGSGVPVVGLQNSTWAPLVAKNKFGWAEPDEVAATSRLRNLTPAELDDARRAGLDFVRPFEDVARRRVEHLVACAEGAA